MRTDVIDQILVMALHPAYGLETAKMSVSVIINIAQSPEAHTYIVREEVMEKMLEICEQKEKKVNEKSLHGQGENEDDLMAVKVLKYVTAISVSSFLHIKDIHNVISGGGGDCINVRPLWFKALPLLLVTTHAHTLTLTLIHTRSTHAHAHTHT
jgi:hypothetical protein